MRRDVCHFYAAPVDRVYHAYLTALGNDKFDRECREEPYHTLTFGLNFSMKFNFNGGSCIVHFIPYQGGTAVDLRFVLAQGAGARYEKYDRELCDDVVAVLGVPPQPLDLDIEVFTDERNQVTPDTYAPPAAPAAAPVMAPPPAPAPVPTPAYAVAPPPPQPAASGRTCQACGQSVGDGDKFCRQCGAKLEPPKRFCRQCGEQVGPDDLFCFACGNKL